MCKSLNFKVLPATDWHDAVSRCDAIGMRLAKIKSPKIQLEINRLFEEGFIASYVLLF